MVLTDLNIHYADCAHCGSSSCISSYQARTVVDLEALHRAVYRVCSHCGNKLGIQEIKATVVKMR